MPIFKPLPEVETCCFVTPLPAGCYSIAVYYLLSGVFLILFAAGVSTYITSCEHKCTLTLEKVCPDKTVDRATLNIVFIALAIILIVACLIFIVGIAMHSYAVVSIFMYIFTIQKLLELATNITIMALSGANGCQGPTRWGLVCMIYISFNLGVALYLLIVTKSFRTTVE